MYAKQSTYLHEEFFETTYKQVNLFIVGTGNVGANYWRRLQQQLSFLQQQMRLQIQSGWICNSRKMVINEEGIDLGTMERTTGQG